MAINRGPGGSGDASNAASNASAIATVKAQEAAESAASALSSANNAAISASSASASASSATASASAASGSATTASSASTTATTQAGIATTKASEASTSAANALTSETNAATSADLAEDWAIKTSGPVSGSEYSSKYHAGLAATSATSANDAKTAAETARDQTLAVYDSFDDRYLGTKASDPTVDNDGDPLVAGSLYFNSVSGVMRLYTGSAWVAAYVSGTASGILNTPAGNIASTNVQDALNELDGEKQPTLTAGSITTSLIANNAITSAKMANGGAEFGMRNRLINAQGIINQRGYVSGTATSGANQYTLDRWRVVTSGQNLTFTTTNNVTTFTAPAGGVEQVIEGVNLESGTYNLNWTGNATATVGGTSVANGGSISVTGGTNLTIRFTGGTFSLPQFEKGTQATPFEWRPYGQELALCQRYYYKQNTSGANGGYTQFGFGNGYGTGIINLTVTFPVSMRSYPNSLDTSAMGTFQYETGTSAGNTPTSIAINPNNNSTWQCTIDVTKSAAFTNGAMYKLQAFNNTTAYLGFGAEL